VDGQYEPPVTLLLSQPFLCALRTPWRFYPPELLCPTSPSFSSSASGCTNPPFEKTSGCLWVILPVVPAVKLLVMAQRSLGTDHYLVEEVLVVQNISDWGRPGMSRTSTRVGTK
jgi:hypothetical protein